MKIPGNLRVLYAEDSEDARLMVSILLEVADIEVTAAKTVAEAWRLAQTQHFDLYLLDTQFPVGNGLDLCRRLHKYSSQTPILFYSGNAFEIDKLNGLAAGAKEYLTKPYIDNLAGTILSNIETAKKPAAEIVNNSRIELQKIDEVQMFSGIFENLIIARGI